jgi:hypothetical protein
MTVTISFTLTPTETLDCLADMRALGWSLGQFASCSYSAEATFVELLLSEVWP